MFERDVNRIFALKKTVQKHNSNLLVVEGPENRQRKEQPEDMKNTLDITQETSLKKIISVLRTIVDKQ